MVISSRTPEGTPNRCPICGNDLRIEPSTPTLDAPCPHCGHLLWFAPEYSAAERKGMVEGMSHALLEVLRARFGPLDKATQARIQAKIESITEPQRLRELLERTAKCRSLEELFSNP